MIADGETLSMGCCACSIRLGLGSGGFDTADHRLIRVDLSTGGRTRTQRTCGRPHRWEETPRLVRFAMTWIGERFSHEIIRISVVGRKGLACCHLVMLDRLNPNRVI